MSKLQTMNWTSPSPDDRRLFRQWMEEFARAVLRFELSAPSRDPVTINQWVGQLGALTMTGCTATPYLVSRDAKIAADDEDAFAFIFPRRARLYLKHRGFEGELAENQPCLLRISEPSVNGSRQPSDAIAVVFRADLLRQRIGNIDGPIPPALPPDASAIRLLRDYAALAERELAGEDEALERAMANHLVDLAALVFAPSSDNKEHVRQGGLKALRRDAVLKYLARKFADPSINLAETAAFLGLSSRYVQLLLEESGTTFSAKLKEMRMAHARAMLSDRRYDGLRIADIAFESGFSDISSFNRAFRKETGDTPSAIRAARRAPS